MITSVLVYLASCQVQKLKPLSHPIRLKTETNCNSGSRVFPRFRQFAFFFFSLSSYWLMVMFSFILIGCFDKFVFGVAALNRNALHKVLQDLAYQRVLVPCASVIQHPTEKSDLARVLILTGDFYSQE